MLSRRRSVRRLSVLDPIEEVSNDSLIAIRNSIIEPRCVSVGYSVNAPINMRPSRRRMSVGAETQRSIYRQSLIVEPILAVEPKHSIKSEPNQDESLPMTELPFEIKAQREKENLFESNARQVQIDCPEFTASQFIGQCENEPSTAEQSFLEMRKRVVNRRQSTRRESVKKFRKSLTATTESERPSSHRKSRSMKRDVSQSKPALRSTQESSNKCNRGQVRIQRQNKTVVSHELTAEDDDYSHLPSYARPTKASKARAAATKTTRLRKS